MQAAREILTAETIKEYMAKLTTKPGISPVLNLIKVEV